jgi:CHAT domain-containing protein
MPVNVDLVFSRRGRAYELDLSSAEARSAGSFTMPHSKAELVAFRQLQAASSSEGWDSASDGPAEAVKDFGGKLFEALTDGPTGTAFRSIEAASARSSEGLRLRLFLAQTPELMNLPWEYLYDRAFNRFLCLSKDTAVVRYLDVPTPMRPLVVAPPLHILVVLATPNDLPLLQLQREWDGLNEALAEPVARGQVVLERLTPATVTSLRRRIRRDPPVHVFHFAGHGAFRTEPPAGVVVFEDEDSGGQNVIDGEELALLLSSGTDIRVAMINAAEGAVTGRKDPYVGVVQALVANGIPAVVGLQGIISDRAAIALAQEFYSALCEGLPVDTALVEGRRAIRFADQELEWGVPVLYLRSADGNLFDVTTAPAPMAATVGGALMETGDVAGAVTASMGRDPTTGEALPAGPDADRTSRSLVRDVALEEPGAPTILMLSASPLDNELLRVDEEAREIQGELDRSTGGKGFSLVTRPALRYADLQYELLRSKPTVLHFSGHGETSGIYVEDQAGDAHLVSGPSLAGLLAIPVIRRRLRLVVLNACLSADQAKAIAGTIDGMVVGMSNKVSETAAIEFARGLYRALGDPMVDLQSAFELARNQVALAGLVSEEQTPQRFIRDGFDPQNAFLVSV